MATVLPSVSGRHHWLALAAAALVEASAYDDKAEVSWFSKVNDPNMSFESFADSGTARCKNLDMMLANLLESKIGKGGELGRLVAAKSQSVYRAGGLITGRQIAHLCACVSGPTTRWLWSTPSLTCARSFGRVTRRIR